LLAPPVQRHFSMDRKNTNYEECPTRRILKAAELLDPVLAVDPALTALTGARHDKPSLSDDLTSWLVGDSDSDWSSLGGRRLSLEE
jgi:hypothetical protein